MTDKINTQIATEMYFNKKAVWERIENEIDREPELMECMFQATMGITRWASDFDGYESKAERLEILLEKNAIGELVRHAMVLVMMLDDRPDLITSLAGQLAPRIKGMAEHKDAVVTAGEILTLMCDFDCFDMEKVSYYEEDEETGANFHVERWTVRNPWELSDATVKHIKHAMYLPPMIVQPLPLESNTDSPFLTIEKDSLILGKKNHHNKDICLDNLNRFNSIPLSVNVQYLKTVEQFMEDDVVDMEEETRAQYEKFMEDSMYVYAYLVREGNRFFLPHKPDKRGRTYAQGYHASTQGNAFRKGAIDLANKQHVVADFGI